MSDATRIKQTLRELGDAEIAERSAGFFKTGEGEYGEGERFIGVRVPTLRRIAKEHRELPEKDVVALLRSEFHEERLLAIFVLVLQFERGDSAQRQRVYELYLENLDYVNNWDLVDSSAPKILGPYLRDRDRSLLHRLADSDSLWERRVAMLTTFTFIRDNDFDDAIAIAEKLIGDSEDLIHKAVGWMLREIGSRDQDLAEQFLAEHAREMPRTMLRYAIEKFPKSKRKRYLMAAN